MARMVNAAAAALLVPMLTELVQAVDEERNLEAGQVVLLAAHALAQANYAKFLEYCQRRLLWHRQHPGSGHPLLGRRFSNADSLKESLFLRVRAALTLGVGATLPPPP